MKALRFAALLAVAGCGPETTSFRSTEQGEGGVATYDVQFATRDVASVKVSSNGGYISGTEEPMTHVGFEIRNTSARTIAFDTEALRLNLAGKGGIALPRARFTTVTPLGPSLVPIAEGATVSLDAYFLLPVRPRAVESMKVEWSLRYDNKRYERATPFVRDDDYPVIEVPGSPSS